MLKSRPDESDTLVQNNRRSTFTNHQLKIIVRVVFFTDEIAD